MPFRTAHSIVGRIAASGGRPSLADLDGIALELAGFRASERGFSEADLTRALDPKSNVSLRANTGGPAPKETERMVRERRERIAAGEERLRERRERTERALGELRAIR
jgi:argininosuccinate lyase